MFVNNTAGDVGGAVYAEKQSAAPCLFIGTDYSAKISFISNIAIKHIGQHIYGTSVRDLNCHILALLHTERNIVQIVFSLSTISTLISPFILT